MFPLEKASSPVTFALVQEFVYGVPVLPVTNPITFLVMPEVCCGFPHAKVNISPIMRYGNFSTATAVNLADLVCGTLVLIANVDFSNKSVPFLAVLESYSHLISN